LQALVLLLMIALDEGSLCLEATEANFRKRLEALVEATEAAWWAKRLAKDWREQDFSNLIGEEPVKLSPQTAPSKSARRS